MELAQDRVQWQALVLAVLNLRVLLPGSLFTIVSFPIHYSKSSSDTNQKQLTERCYMQHTSYKTLFLF
jgi:hypothetical protein